MWNAVEAAHNWDQGAKNILPGRVPFAFSIHEREFNGSFTV